MTLWKAAKEVRVLWYPSISCWCVLHACLIHGLRHVVLASDRWTPAAHWLLRQIARLPGTSLSGTATARNLGGQVGRGRLARAYTAERLLHACASAFAQAASSQPTFCTAAEYRNLLASYFIVRNDRACKFIAAVHGAHADDAPPAKIICYAPFLAVGGFAATQANRQLPDWIRVRPFPNLAAWFEMVRVLPGNPVQIFKALRQGPAAARVDPAARSKGIALAQLQWRALCHYPAAGHLYWAAPSGLAPEQVVVYGPATEAPAMDALHAKLDTVGLGWIEGGNLYRHLAHPLRDIVRALRSSGLHRPQSCAAEHWVRWAVVAAAAVRLECYRALFQTYNVAFIHHYMEPSPETQCIAIAARAENAIVVWNYWSAIPILFARYNFASADLVFSWGDNDTGYYVGTGFQARNLVQVGIVAADGEGVDDADNALRLRSRFAAQVQFVLTIFDNSFGPEVYISEDYIRDFYMTLLSLLEANPSWGCIVKPKKTLRDVAWPGLLEQIERLTAEGRCQVLDVDTKIGIANLAGDLIVALPISSAAIVGAITGRPAVHFDPTGLIHNPLYQAGLERFVFSTPAALADAILRFSQGDRAIGDHAAIAASVDCFGDRAGNRRAGQILGNYVRARQYSLSAASALNSALATYTNGEGAGRVFGRQTLASVQTPWREIRAGFLAPTTSHNDRLES